jgi:hypothetical protein
VNTCPTPAEQFLLSPGLIGSADRPEVGWVVLAFCARHRDAVLDFVLPRLGAYGEDAIVAEIAALPLALRDVAGIDAAIDGLDQGVVTNLFQLAAV